MDGCNCPIVTRDELKALFDSEEAEQEEQAIAHLVELLTSRDKQLRAQGYRLFEEGIADALFCSCLNYRALVGGFTHPLLKVIRQAVEAWAASKSDVGTVRSCGRREP
jgi:glutathione S-transferase